MKKLLGPRVGRRWGKVGVFAADRATFRAWFENPFLAWARRAWALVLFVALVALFQRFTRLI